MTAVPIPTTAARLVMVMMAVVVEVEGAFTTVRGSTFNKSLSSSQLTGNDVTPCKCKSLCLVNATCMGVSVQVKEVQNDNLVNTCYFTNQTLSSDQLLDSLSGAVFMRSGMDNRRSRFNINRSGNNRRSRFNINRSGDDNNINRRGNDNNSTNRGAMHASVNHTNRAPKNKGDKS
ncbi:hypothetical protein Pcinc_022435 [Petrolisthes cinctipes]|uniref:Apple domain-containing protein n=1 Tax=Petrolisthes cinctipes TaxID=88211 RepID=A0AAE1FE69_PETCI|nr:hypothetical protein Pcinc_022435 [Petrolisthes cinctipes]